MTRPYNERRNKQVMVLVERRGLRRSQVMNWIKKGKTVKWVASHLHLTIWAVYKILNRPDVKERAHFRSAKSYSVSNPIPVALRWAIWERDNFTCKKCGKRQFLSVDHIRPASRGGLLDESNLQTLCSRCNSVKGNRSSFQIIPRNSIDSNTKVA